MVGAKVRICWQSTHMCDTAGWSGVVAPVPLRTEAGALAETASGRTGWHGRTLPARTLSCGHCCCRCGSSSQYGHASEHQRAAEPRTHGGACADGVPTRQWGLVGPLLLLSDDVAGYRGGRGGVFTGSLQDLFE
jgi:hypothetical protein